MVLVGVGLLLVGAGACRAERTRAGTPDVFVAQLAAGSADGSSCANARAVSLFNDASNWGAGKPIDPGTVIGLCGTITSTLTARGSGTRGSPVTIRFQPGAKISQPVSNALILNGRSYITVDGGTNGVIEATDNGTGLGHQSSSTAIDAEPCNDCTIENLTIQNIYIHTGSGSEVSNSGENCIKFSGSGWQIRDNTMHDASWCVRDVAQSGDTDIHVHDNSIYNIDHGFTVEGGYPNIGNVWFNNNHVHDMANWDDAGSAYHHDGVHCYTSGHSGAARHIDNFYMYDNRFDGNAGIHATAWIFLEGAPRGDSSDTPCNDSTSNIWAFNNVMTSTRPITNSILSISNGHVFVANDTIDGADPTNPQTSCLGVLPGGTYINNAVGGCNQLVNGASTPAALDHNAYANCSGSYNCYAIGPSNLWTASFATYRASFPSLDAHTVADYSAATGSNTGGIGENLASYCTGNLVPLCYDINGNLRPLRMPPDVGAYQRETAAITPNGVGAARIGASQISVAQFYGRRPVVRSSRPIFGSFDIRGVLTATYHLHRATFTVSYARGKVAAVSTTSLYYTTADGFGVGVPADSNKLALDGWKSCGLNLFERRRHGNAMAVHVVRGRVASFAVSRSANLLCP